MKDKIVFEDYEVEFTDKDFEDVDKETLIECKKKIEDTIKKLKGGE